ncbi:MAG TPA: ABC transporter substrate-binding protein, partial [Nocardioides sp.]|nr:ABC transporter substrate-binding protein [Nocardioides sp.]
MSHVSIRHGWKTRWKVMALVGVMSLGLAACGNSSSSGGSGGSGGDLTIGASLPLTGDFSEPGSAAKQGYQVWQTLINANGGLLGKQVKLVIKDDASNQNTIVTDYNA